MKMRKFFVVLATMIGAADALGGHLWIAAEFASTNSIVRYNIDTGLIDLVYDPGLVPTDVYNNLATDGSTLYIGVDDSQLFAKADVCTGVVSSVGAYAPPVVAASLEDGAFDGVNLWRATNSTDVLHQTTTAGAVLSSAVVSGINFFTGLEWVGPTLYATSLDGALFGSIAGPLKTAPSFTPIPLAGIPGGNYYGGLAYDQKNGVLYMATTDLTSVFLWKVDPGLGIATLVVNLTSIGFPTGPGYVLPDAMGWAECGIKAPAVSGWGTTVLVLMVLAGLTLKFARRQAARV